MRGMRIRALCFMVLSARLRKDEYISRALHRLQANNGIVGWFRVLDLTMLHLEFIIACIDRVFYLAPLPGISHRFAGAR